MTNVPWRKRNSAREPTSGVAFRSSVHHRAISSGMVKAFQTRCGAAAMMSSLTMAAIAVPFRFHVAMRLYLTYRLSIADKGNGVKGCLALDLSALPGHALIRNREVLS